MSRSVVKVLTFRKRTAYLNMIGREGWIFRVILCTLIALLIAYTFITRPAGERADWAALGYIKIVNAAELEHYSQFGRYAELRDIQPEVNNLATIGAEHLQREVTKYYRVMFNRTTSGYIVTLESFHGPYTSYYSDQTGSIRYARNPDVATAISPILKR